MDHQVENVARAFYDASEEGLGWESEPESLHDEFRRYAREAITVLQEQHDEGLGREANRAGEALIAGGAAYSNTISGRPSRYALS